MRVLFVHAWQGFCLAEWYLRDALRTRCSVTVSMRAIDVPSNGIPANDLLIRSIAVQKPDIVGFSCHYWSLDAFLEAASWVKRLHPPATVVFGGPQVMSPEAAADVLSRSADVDFVVVGDGEEALCRLCEHVDGRHPNLETIPGLSYRVPTGVRHSPGGSSGSLKRGVIFRKENLDLADQLRCVSEASYETTRGCRSVCAYCVYPTNRFELLDDELVKGELSYLCGAGLRYLRICDTHFGGSKQRAKELLRFLSGVNRGTRLKIYPDLLHVDEEFVNLLKEAGADVISIGVETTNPKSLEKIHRLPMHERREAIRLILSAFPDVPADVIVGLPGDDMEGLERTFVDVLRLGFRTVNVFRLSVFPGTPLANDTCAYYTEPLSLTSQGHILSTPNFPAERSADLANLVHAVQVLAPLVRTRAVISGGNHTALSALARSADPEQLFQLHTWFASPHRSVLGNHVGEAVEMLEEALHIDSRHRGALIQDLEEVSGIRPAGGG